MYIKNELEYIYLFEPMTHKEQRFIKLLSNAQKVIRMDDFFKTFYIRKSLTSPVFADA